jgi:ABC-type nitrate/sulfonate/bicarbonate transport system substrate-binding protein
LRELIDLNQHADPLARLNSATLRPLVVDRSFLESHSDLVVRYLTVLLRTAAWADHHHDEVVQLISTEAGGLRASEVVEAYGPDVHRAFTPALTPPYVSALEEQKNFLRDWRFLPADFSVINWVVADPLVEAQERVRRLPPLVG